jgi:Zn ribbon nucleic-acid-binding protein
MTSQSVSAHEPRSIPTSYCPSCRMMRAIRNWHERREMLEIELEPCGHVARRSARLEWDVKRLAA